MVYVDEGGNLLESVDLSLGRLEDHEWIDHPEISEEGHYEYADFEDGGQLQKYVIDIPYQAPYREVIVQKYILFTEEELEAIARGDYSARLDKLEGLQAEYLDAYKRGVQNA